MRIGTTSATTASTTMMPIVYPITHPVVLVPAARTFGCMSGSSLDRFAKVADGLKACVDRGEPLRNRAGQAGDGLDPSGGSDQCLPDGPQVEDDPQQAERGDRDNQRGDDNCEPGGCWHGLSPFPLSREAWRRSRRTGPPRRRLP